jgi:hypothetical protein
MNCAKLNGLKQQFRVGGINVPLSDLLLNVLIHGTSYKERGTGKGVSMTRTPGDVILFFNTDNNNCKVKQNTTNTCDLLIFVSNERIPTKILALVEIKGSDVDHAVEQIKQTYQYIHRQLNTCVNNYTRHFSAGTVKWLGIILRSNSSPVDYKKYKKELEKLGIKLLEPITHRKRVYSLDNKIRSEMR